MRLDIKKLLSHHQIGVLQVHKNAAFSVSVVDDRTIQPERIGNNWLGTYQAVASTREEDRRSDGVYPLHRPPRPPSCETMTTHATLMED